MSDLVGRAISNGITFPTTIKRVDQLAAGDVVVIGDGDYRIYAARYGSGPLNPLYAVLFTDGSTLSNVDEAYTVRVLDPTYVYP